MKTRCKFQVKEVARQSWNTAKSGEPPKYAEKIKLSAVCGDDDPENVSFSQATPQGELEIFVTNPLVVGGFEPGSFYYLDLTPCSK